MAFNIKVPGISNDYENSSEVPGVIATIKNKYGGIISNIAALLNFEEAIIYGFIYVESKGKENAVSGKSIGLMQINPQTANTAIIRENLNRGLTPDEINYLQTYLGSRLKPLLAAKFTWQLPINGVTKNDLLEPEFNILVASMYLKQLIFKTKEGNKIRLDRVIWLYNKGEFSKLPKGDIANVYANAGDITGKYIRTLLGENGVLTQLT